MNEMLLLTIAAVAAIFLIMTCLKSRKPTPEEAAAIYKVACDVGAATNDGLTFLETFKNNGELEQQIRLTRQELEQCIERYTAKVREIVPQVIDNRVYGLTVKGLVMRLSREELSLILSEAGGKIFNEEEFRREIKAVLQNGYIELVRKVEDAMKNGGDRAYSDEIKSQLQTVWQQLNARPGRRNRLAGRNKDFIQVIGKQMLSDELAPGIAMMVSGVVMRGLANGISSHAGTILSQMSSQFIGVDLFEYVLDILAEWLREQVGEELMSEVFEAVAAALTGIGIVFTAYKTLKYAGLVKRLVWDKEPLQKMRGHVVSHFSAGLQTTGQALCSESDKSIRSVADDMKTKLLSLNNASKERMAWAQRYMSAPMPALALTNG